MGPSLECQNSLPSARRGAPTAGSSPLCRDDLRVSWIRPADRSPRLLRLLRVALHPLRRLRAPLPSAWACPTPASPARHPPPRTPCPPLGADRGSHVLPSRVHHCPHHSCFWSNVSAGFSVLTSTAILLPPRPSKSQVPSAQLARVLPLRNSHPHSRLKSLTPGAYAYTLPSLGMSFLGFENNFSGIS